MKTFLIRISLFFALPILVGAAWTAFVVVMDYRSYTHALTAPEGSTIAVCGDSQTKDALNPAFVPGLFNFSTAATTCDQDLLRLLDVLHANRGRFKYVLLDVSPLKIGYTTDRPVDELNAARVHALLHIYHLPVNRRDLGSVGALWRDVVCTRKYNEFRKSILRGRPWRSSMAGQFDPDKACGFLNPKFREKALADVQEKADRVNRRPEATIDLPIFGVLVESIGLVRAAGAIPIVTTMPLAKPLREAMDARKLAAFREATRDIAVRLGVDQFDYLDLDLADEFWHDGNHLNRAGAEVFSRRFSADLSRLQGRMAPPMQGGCWSIEPICEVARPRHPEDLSGLTWEEGDRYWSVSDTAGELCELRIPMDLSTGIISGCEILRRIEVPGGRDLEGSAYDPLRKSIWLSDEKGPTIFEFHLEDRRVGARLELPREFLGIQKNRGLEALEIVPDGRTMWTCNENELPADDSASPGPCEFLRLTSFSRCDASSSWRISGQWAYRPETPGGLDIRGRARNGVSSLCVLEDGTVLVLERECLKKGKSRFRMRIYQADTMGATDVRGWMSLGDADFVPIRKRLLFEADTGSAMYEGMCVGPTLEDGSRSLLLISDGDGAAVECLKVLRLRRQASSR